MSDDALVAIIAIAVALVAGSIGIWFGLRLVQGVDFKRDRFTRNGVAIACLVAAALASSAWYFGDGRLRFADACGLFVVAIIAVIFGFRRPKGF